MTSEQGRLSKTVSLVTQFQLENVWDIVSLLKIGCLHNMKLQGQKDKNLRDPCCDVGMHNCEYPRWRTRANFEVKYLGNKESYKKTLKEVII